MDKLQQRREETARTIIKQLGGFDRLKAIINASGFIVLESGVMFTFSCRSKYNRFKAVLSAPDLYNVTFFRFTMNSYDFDKISTKNFKNLYADQLKIIFEEETGLCQCL